MISLVAAGPHARFVTGISEKILGGTQKLDQGCVVHELEIYYVVRRQSAGQSSHMTIGHPSFLPHRCLVGIVGTMV